MAPAADVSVSSRALDGVLSFVPDDMYIVAGAGTPLKSLRGFLEAKNRILPLVSPWEETTVGGLVAANLNGPLRARYGGVKDLLLCMEVILPDRRSTRPVGRSPRTLPDTTCPGCSSGRSAASE